MKRQTVYRVLFPVLLILSSLAVTGALLWGGEALYFGPVVSDLGETFYLWRVFLARWLHRGIFPFWDMHAFGGYPVIEKLQDGLLFPPSLLPLLVFSPAFGLKVWMALCVGIAQLGSYVALRRAFRLEAGWAFVGTMVYVFGGAFATRVEAGHFAVVGAMAFWLPALGCVWVVARSCTAGRLTSVWQNRHALAGAVVANGLVILAGSPQYVAYLFYVEVLAVLIAVPAGRRGFALLVFAAIWAGSAALSAPQWYPTIFYLPFTGRSSGRWMTAPTSADRWNFLIEALLPFPLGDDLSNPHMHLKNVWETCTYAGTMTLVLALASLVMVAARGYRRWPREMKLAWGIVLLGLYLCGGGWLPGFSSFREPLKARAVVGLGLALAAAFGGRILFATDRLEWRKRLFRGVHVGTLVAIAWAGMAIAVALLLPRHAEAVGRWLLSGGPPVDALRAVAWQRVCAEPALLIPPVVAACWRVAGWAFLAGVLIGGVRWRPRLFMSLLCVAAALDPFSTYFRVFVSRHPFTNIGFPPGFAAAIESEIKQTRAAHGLSWRVTLPASLANRGHLVDGLWDTGGYDPLMPRDANVRVALETRRLDLSVEDKRTTIALAVGRRYDFSRWAPEYGQPLGDLRHWEVAPRPALFSLERELRPGYEGTQAFGPNLDDAKHYVDEAPPKNDGRREAAEDVQAFVKRVQQVFDRHRAPLDLVKEVPAESPNEYAYQVTCTEPALAIFRTTWLPGWQVWIDGRYWGRPWCANRWMLAAPIEPGTHEIRWIYRPVGFWPSILVSCLTCLALLALVVGQGTRTKEQGA